MGKRVQFAHIKFGSEPEGLDSGALQFGGKSVEFAASVGEVSFADLGDDDAAAFGTNFETTEIGGSAAQGFVGDVEAVLNARVSSAVKAMGAEKEMEFAHGLDGIGEERFDGTSGLAACGARVVRRRALGAEMSAGTIFEKCCGALYQKTAPISAMPKGHRWEKKESGHRAGAGKEAMASGGSPASIRVERGGS